MAAVTFPRFRQLPLELQTMIWSSALHQPRLLEVDYRFPPRYARRHARKKRRTSGTILKENKSYLPSLFLACRESWYEAQKFYKPFAAHHCLPANISDLGPEFLPDRFLFSPVIDTVYLPNNKNNAMFVRRVTVALRYSTHGLAIRKLAIDDTFL